MCEKTAYREKFKRLRAACKSAERDARIAENALAAFAGRSGSFFVYLSFGTETGTEELIARLLKNGKTVCVPRLSEGAMSSVLLTDRLERGAYGVMQPAGGAERTCGVAFCPLLAFDGEGYRLGYGGGYYDRYLAAHPGVLRVGLAYEGQAADRLPHDASDARLDAVVTERGVRFFPPRNT